MHIRDPHKAEDFSIGSNLSWKLVASCALATASLVMPCFAQKGGTGGGSGGGGGPRGGTSGPVIRPGGSSYPAVYSSPAAVPATTAPILDVQPLPKPVMIEDEKCLPWDISEGRDTAVSIKRLKVPSGAKSEFQKACDANNKQKFDLAEQHARKAIDKFNDYSAAWVMLGVVLEEQHKPRDARDACSRAINVDSKYVPAYLCNAEFSTRDRQWDQVLNVANLAFGLNSAGDSYADYYRATAYYYMNNLDDAKKSALHAEENEISRNRTPLHFLLAHIYDAEGDKTEAAAQLRQILKQHNDKQDEDAVKQYLTQIESQDASK